MNHGPTDDRRPVEVLIGVNDNIVDRRNGMGQQGRKEKERGKWMEFHVNGWMDFSGFSGEARVGLGEPVLTE